MKLRVVTTTGILGLALATACANPPMETEDGRDDQFTDGKGDTGGVIEGSPEAVAVLQVANRTSYAELVADAGLSDVAADNIVEERAIGLFLTLAELDAVPFVGPGVFGKLLAYAYDHHLVVERGYQLADRPRIAWNALLEFIPPGSTDAAVGMSQWIGRKRECSEVTGCQPWTSASGVYITGHTTMYLPANEEVILRVLSGGPAFSAALIFHLAGGYWLNCYVKSTAATAPVGRLECYDGPRYGSSVSGIATAGFIYADGTYHLVSFISDSSTEQIALSGRLVEGSSN